MSTSSRAEGRRPLARFLSPVLLLALMWAIQALDAVLPGSFTGYGLRSWDPGSIAGLAIGPVLHTGWPHLLSNSVPFLVLGCIVAVEGTGRFWSTTAVIALIGGAGTWLVNTPGTVTVGASVLVFGYAGYILLRTFTVGAMAHRVGYAVVAIVMVALYGGSMLTGILPIHQGISWQAHLFGAVGGGVAALIARPRRSGTPEIAGR